MTRSHQIAQPNRLKILLESPIQRVLDQRGILLKFGCSDYFTVKTIQEISVAARQGRLQGLTLSEIFTDRWSEGGKRFPGNWVPYHVSAQGVIINHDRTSGNEYLILTSINTQSETLVHGWGATMAEQMQAPDPSSKEFRPWWRDYLSHFQVSAPETRGEGDVHIQDALTRGLKEEFGLLEGRDYDPDPRLLNACIEADMYFVTFIFMVRANLTLAELHSKWENAEDHKENALIAAYPITNQKDPERRSNRAKQLAQLLVSEQFDGAPYVLPKRRESSLMGKWHPSSQMRIYVAGRHLFGDDFERYVDVEN